MTGPDLPDPSVPDECRAWVDQTYRKLDIEATRQAMRGGDHKMHRHGAAAQLESCTDAVCELVDAVLAGEYARAHALCHSALAHPDIGPRRVYALIMLPAIRMVGKAWADDTAPFEQTSLAFSLLYRLIDRLAQANLPGYSGQISARMPVAQQRVLVTVAPAEKHSFGALILTQELRLRGWSVTYLDHTQPENVFTTLADQGFDTLAISVSCDESLAGLADFVSNCRMANARAKLDVLIGGAAIQAPFGQYDFLQADKVGLGIEEVGDYLLSQERKRRAGKWN